MLVPRILAAMTAFNNGLRMLVPRVFVAMTVLGLLFPGF